MSPKHPLPTELRAATEPGAESAVPASVGRLSEEALYLRGDLRLLQVRAAARLVRDSWWTICRRSSPRRSLGRSGSRTADPDPAAVGMAGQLALTAVYDGGLRGVQHERSGA